MGNCVSQAGQKEFLKSLRNTTVDSALLDDPNSFLVYVKKKHKFTPGVLKVTDREILFLHGVTEVESWPFLYLRRYGFTSGGVFFFESGRRCSSGEGLHTFQTCQSGAIFQLVQSRIQDSATTNFALGDSTGQSIVDNIRNACLYRTGRVPTNSRIHPLQRYFSEGVNTVDGTYRSLRLHGHFYRHHRKHNHSCADRPQSLSVAGNPRRSRSLRPFVFENERGHNSAFLMNTKEGHSYANFRVQPLQISSSENHPGIINFSRLNGYSPNTSEFCSSLSESNSPLCDECFFGHYVNVREIAVRTHSKSQETPASSALDYASVNIQQTSDKDVLQASNSASTVSGTPCLSHGANTVDYTEVDLERTQAAEIANKVLELENSQRCHSSNP